MILDASAVLAYLQQEQGCVEVEQVLKTAAISAVNWCEVAQKLRAQSVDDEAVRENLAILGLAVYCLLTCNMHRKPRSCGKTPHLSDYLWGIERLIKFG
jgi:PIN domain nuclease of toxin-antitoxin system